MVAANISQRGRVGDVPLAGSLAQIFHRFRCIENWEHVAQVGSQHNIINLARIHWFDSVLKSFE
jgi:hypothetical protein